jgi:hypothetical protein
MAITFPAAPTNGQVYTDTTSGQSWTWDGVKWKGVSDANLWRKAGTTLSPAVATDTIQGQLVPTNGSLGSRNRIINGDMRIDQRATTTTTSAFYTVDRWSQSQSGGGVVSWARSTVAPAGFSNSLGGTVTTADSSIAGGDFYRLLQPIEGFNVADLNSGTASARPITVSFWVRSSVTGTYCVGFGNNNHNRGYAAEYSISAANTWEYKTVSLTLDQSGTWAADNTVGLYVYWDLGSGSNFNTTANTWSASQNWKTSSQVSWIANSGATFYITGVQLEPGTVATPFERRSYGQELALCQRYYEAAAGIFLSMWPPVSNNAGNIDARRVWLPFVVQKRAAPTVTVTANQGLAGGTTTGYTKGIAHSGAQGAFLETIITAWTASIEL